MLPTAVSDEVLLAGTDPAGFEEFYGRHVDALLGFFSRRTRDAELAADLTAETFAAALSARRRFRPDQGAAIAWLFGIAMKKLADAQRRGYAEKKARRRLGMERIELTDDDVAHIESLGSSSVGTLLQGLGDDQRTAVVQHVIDERDYREIAIEQDTSEAVVRKRVSRGLAVARSRVRRRP